MTNNRRDPDAANDQEEAGSEQFQNMEQLDPGAIEGNGDRTPIQGGGRATIQGNGDRTPGGGDTTIEGNGDRIPD